LSVISSALNGGLAWVMFRVAKVHRSIALEADARHLVTDVWTSVGVVVGIAAVAIHGLAMAGRIGRDWCCAEYSQGGLSFDVALVTGFDGRSSGARGIGVRFRKRWTVLPTTIRFDHVTTRRSGQRRFVDLHMHMPASWSLGRAAALRTSVEQALMSAVPGLSAIPSSCYPAMWKPTSMIRIGAGLLVLLCTERGDTEVQSDKLLARILKLRIFSDQAGKMNHSVQAMDSQSTVGGMLVVSQFTLAADTTGGNRPSFTQAAPPAEGRRMAEPLVAQYGPDVPQAIARMVAAVHPRFDVDAF
jgi:D-tyrosyl-tRNA(Tyr) deacylase